ncbi:hypothetical protein [Maribacter sp.]|uniref:YncE family protein n=1 Tax=Maribacter sp. TaxID=1897614 RepID=UPI0025C0C3C1|nr:hypothetical protein [Maribacter sp.]
MKKKQYHRSLFILSIIISLVASCNPEDGEDGAMGAQGEQGPASEDAITITPAAYGIWEVTSEIGSDVAKYVYINEDNTLNILSEDQLGFKRAERTNVTVSVNQITTNGYYGSLNGINNYEVDGDILTLTKSFDPNPVIMQRSSTAPNPSDWITELTILDEGNTTWDRAVDIAFDGTYLLGFNSHDRNIEQINPNNFSLEGVIPTTRSAYAVEIEKSDDPNRQLFQSDNGFRNYHSYIYSSNSFYYTSIDLGAWITGIASKVPGELWVASGNEQTLYHYFSHGSLSPGEILGTISLDFAPNGLDYRDGFLYVTEGNRVHKCQITPEFRAIETYELRNHNVSGITYDGTNFWLASTNTNNIQKLVKIDLSI